MTRHTLKNLVEKITGHPRYFPTHRLSKTQVVHNVFRTFEYFFGRAYGPNGVGDTIRKEMEVRDRCVEGVIVEREFVYYTLEARLAQYEQNFKESMWRHKYVFLLFLASVALHNPLPFIMGAIAFGGVSAVTTTSNPTSVAVSGSDTLGHTFVAGEASSDQISGVTWDSVTMNKITAVQTPSDRYISAWWIANPASSTTIQYTGGTFWRSFSFYYTGCAQTGQPDASATNTVSSNAAISVTVTVVASNCWLVMCQKDVTGGRVYTPSNALVTTRLDNDAGGLVYADSNGTVSTGSITGTLTQTSGTSDHGAIAWSIKPVSTVTNTGNFFVFF